MSYKCHTVLFLLSLFSIGEGAQKEKNSSQITLGSSLSPNTDPTSWPSASGQFEFGFYPQGSGFAVGIWLVGKDEKTIVWTANRDEPPVASNALLQLTRDGKLVLVRDGEQKLIANAADASSASMLDSGNFVLYNKTHGVIWESFNYPTDTILGGQTLPVDGQLCSSLSSTDHSTGRFHLNMQGDGNLVLYPANSANLPVDAYWSSGTNGNSKFHLYLNNTGRLVLINSNGSIYRFIPSATGSVGVDGNGTIYSASVGVDGIFRLYSHDFDEKSDKLKSPVVIFSAPEGTCKVNGFCGLNSYCTLIDDQSDCLCLPGSDYADVNHRTLGCLRNYTQVACTGGKENTSLYEIHTMENMMWGDSSDIHTMENMMWGDSSDFVANMEMDECSRSCLEDCNCGAALFKDGQCSKQKPPLRYVRRDQSQSTTAFFKVGNITSSTNDISKNQSTNPTTVVVTSKNAMVQILLLTVGFIVFSCFALAISGFYIFKIRVLRYKRLTEINGNLGLANEELTLRVFSYNELRRATNGFKEELGKGSFGAVYKGALNKGRKLIAVKRLEKLVEEGEREFRAEMQAIGRTHHKNLVRLLGYSAEDSKRLLVYEYMSNGSLADLLFKPEWHPAWNERVTIALDVARGLLYLHDECKTPIIHCDIKPQNILMDEFWTAKISDFGLAKLLMPDQTRTFTGVRGTRGYLAPEWQKNTPISVKADVYSYGIVLLEIVCCRRNMDVTVRADEIILSTWVYKCFVGRVLHKLVGGEGVDKKSLENLVKVGLWCIQDEPALRPSMKSVVLMLQGITDISIPPCPTATSM